MSIRKAAALVAILVVTVTVVVTVTIFALWSGGEDPPSPNQPVTTLRQ